ncbi:MAG: aromatic aminobenezylarsenical efflux permease ArsG family transporter [Thermoanaerobaculia bacterium]
MPEMLVSIGTAAWLGVLTAISPCPLATNVAAVAFVSRQGASPRRALAAGLLYTIGRSVAYVLLGALAVFAFEKLFDVSLFLQGTFYKALGPLMIVVGLVLLGLVGKKLSWSFPPSEERVRRAGLWGAPALGAIFALAFCPVSAAIFFGLLIPLAVQHASVVTLPGVYGITTGLPVAAFAIAIAFGAKQVGRSFAVAHKFERWARPATAVVFILIGIYETMRATFHVI